MSATVITQIRPLEFRVDSESASMPKTELSSRLDRRLDECEFNFGWIRGQILAMIASWPEVFEFGCKHAQYDHDRSVELLARPDKTPTKIKEIIDDLNADLANDLNFYRRCSEIYAEEMAEADALAAQARARVADRIEKELREKALAEAIRENDPQKWTLGFEWN